MHSEAAAGSPAPVELLYDLIADQLRSEGFVLSRPAGWVGGSGYAHIQRGKRFVQLFRSLNESSVRVEFWSHGVCMAHGSSPALREAAQGVRFWLEISEAPADTLATQVPWVAVNPLASEFEAGTAAEGAWRRLLTSDALTVEERTMVEHSSSDPRLRTLFPYFSHYSLCFSRCTGYPYTDDTASIHPSGGDYVAIGPDGRELRRGTIASAIRAVLDSLPPICGPAWRGTADDERA